MGLSQQLTDRWNRGFKPKRDRGNLEPKKHPDPAITSLTNIVETYEQVSKSVESSIAKASLMGLYGNMDGLLAALVEPGPMRRRTEPVDFHMTDEGFIEVDWNEQFHEPKLTMTWVEDAINNMAVHRDQVAVRRIADYKIELERELIFGRQALPSELKYPVLKELGVVSE